MIAINKKFQSYDTEIEFNQPGDLPLEGRKRKLSSKNEISFTNFISFLGSISANANIEMRWKKFKQLFSKDMFFVQLDQGILIIQIENSKWFSNVCREKDQLWPESAPVDQDYEFISAYTNIPDVNYFTIRRGLKGRVGELCDLHHGPLLSGTASLDLSMRIKNFLNIERYMLHDESRIWGDGYFFEMRAFLPIISPKPKTFYTDVGFELWKNNPSIDSKNKPISVQSQERYDKAVKLLREWKLSKLKTIDMASDEQLTKLTEFCHTYRVPFESATVHSLGAAIHTAFKVPATKEQASKDFRIFYETCFYGSHSYKAKVYNRALDTLMHYRFWIITSS